MSENILPNFLQRSKMEELLYDLSLGIVNIKGQRLSEEDVTLLCQNGYAYKLTSNKLASPKYLKDSLLKSLKQNEKQDTFFQIEGIKISTFIVFDILSGFVLDGIALQEENTFFPNMDVLISRETVINLCQYRIDPLSVESIVKEMGFKVKGEPKFGLAPFSQAYTRCHKIIITLLKDSILTLHQREIEDGFFWNFSKEV